MIAPRLKVVSTTDGGISRRIDSKKSSRSGASAAFENIGQCGLAELDDMLREFMDRIDDVFFARSDTASNERERKRYFDAMREFRNKRGELHAYFNSQMQRSLAELARHSAYAPGYDDDITRIEIPGAEDKVAIDNLISRARLKFEAELSAIGQRLGALLGMTNIGAEDNPFDPGPICENFHAASALLKIDIAVKLIFYKLFEKQLMAQLGDIYLELDRQFTAHGVPPITGTGGTGGKRVDSTAKASKQSAVASPVVDELTRLQRSANSERSPERVDPEKFRRSLRKQVDSLRRNNRKSLSSRDAKSIESVAMLFDFFFDDEALPDPIKVLIGQLQVAVLKVAIVEPDFLTRKQHPARRLLDTVSRTSLAWSENHRSTRMLVGKTQQVVDFVVARYQQDAAVFEAACIDFEDFVNRQREKREQAENRSSTRGRYRQQNIDDARKAVAALIGRLTKDRDLDPEVIKFLRTTWTSVLVKTLLSLGESSNHWRNLKRISTTLVWTLIPRHTEAERDKIIRTIPALLRALSKGMALINTDMQIQNRVFAVLAKEHARVVKQTSQNIVTRVDDTTIWPLDEAERELAMTGNLEDEDISVTCVDPDRIDADVDAVMLIDSIGTNEVIKNMNQFTAGVRRGSIRIDEEIVLSGDDDDDLEFDIDETASDKYLQLAIRMETGSWVEFMRPDETSQLLKLSWKSAAAGTLVFVNANGQKVKNMTINDFAGELRSNRARRRI